ncbi:MAG TPA: hypothetical protein VN328_02245, partial [Thermodesulfovibrionales bacterium]|nr:hypothetical protein [Thermodesulfovibrionales bacterium]
IQIVSVRDKTAAAIVRESHKEVSAGDAIGLAAGRKPAPKAVASTQVNGESKKVSAGDAIGHAAGRESAPKAVASTQGYEEGFETMVNLFMDQYVRAYESGDIDRFMSLYSTSAVENSSLRYNDIKRAYQENFQGNRYAYTLRNVEARKSGDYIILTGAYYIKKLQGSASGATTQGKIRWSLIKEDGSLKILRADNTQEQ